MSLPSSPKECKLALGMLAMHELGIAEAIVDRVKQESEKRGGARVTKVGVRVGELSGVDPDALSFGFEMLVKDTPFEGLALEIDFRKRVQRCAACGRAFETDMLFGACPDCGSSDTACIAGDELDIAFIELEDPACV
jgi:hydrogenase nickel incorporation protein HypA/HybF